MSFTRPRFPLQLPRRVAIAPLFALSLLAGMGEVPVSAAAPPNIVFIMADDLGYGDLGCYGQQLIATPHIDRLASEGMRFTQAYAGGPVCAASRAVLLTGLHTGHAPARDNVPHYPTYLEAEDLTVAEVLRQAGYRCGGVGKWSLGDAGTVGRATNQGFDMWLGYLNQDHAHYYFTEYLDDNDGRLELGGNTQSRTHYSHDLLTQRALEFIGAAGDNAVPFFLYVAYTLPHFGARTEDPDGLPVPSTDPYSDRDWDVRSQKYAAMIHRLDQDVGRLVERVDSCGLGSSTLIICTSDNGGHESVDARFRTNGPLRGFKRDLTEGGIRVPFIARWPGFIPSGRVSDEVIAFQDMLPTFAQLAGAETPARLDGISVVEALRGGRLTPPQRMLYWDYGHCRRRYDQAVRWGDWKAVRLGVDADVQLFNLADDVAEQHDVAGEHPDVLEEMKRFMETAATPSERYPIGEIYRGEALWKPERN